MTQANLGLLISILIYQDLFKPTYPTKVGYRMVLGLPLEV